jgi:hypothetical protein
LSLEVISRDEKFKSFFCLEHAEDCKSTKDDVRQIVIGLAYVKLEQQLIELIETKQFESSSNGSEFPQSHSCLIQSPFLERFKIPIQSKKHLSLTSSKPSLRSRISFFPFD